MRLCVTIQRFVLVVGFAACPLASQIQTDTAQAVQFLLRTRWEDGVLQYVVTLTDSKGKIAKWFSKHPDSGPVPLSSFQVTCR
jgi:hypothetical protein